MTTHQIIYNNTAETETDKRQHFYIDPNPGTVSIIGSPLFEDIVYLPNLKSAYTIQSSSSSTGACTRASCYVTSGANEKISLMNVNYLIFPDAQIGI